MDFLEIGFWAVNTLLIFLIFLLEFLQFRKNKKNESRKIDFVDNPIENYFSED